MGAMIDCYGDMVDPLYPAICLSFSFFSAGGQSADTHYQHAGALGPGGRGQKVREYSWLHYVLDHTQLDNPHLGTLNLCGAHLLPAADQGCLASILLLRFSLLLIRLPLRLLESG